MILVVVSLVYAYAYIPGVRTRADIKSAKLYMFGDFFKNLGKQPKDKDPAPAPQSAARVKKNGKVAAYKLEKISNTQKRDWKKMEADALKNKPKEEIVDKQVESYNFKKANEFPNLYDGWLNKGGTDQIAKQAISSVKSAQGKVKYMEVLFDPVPNLDEVAFGTLNNKRLRQDVVSNLKVPDYVTNRGGPSTLEWSNLYWMNRIAAGIGGKKVLAVSISGEGCKSKKPEEKPIFTKGVTLMTLVEAKKQQKGGTLNTADIVIILSPCSKMHYESAISLGESTGAKSIIALNSPYSYIYDIGGGDPFELVFCMKRIPKGWCYRVYPRPFEAVIEGPNYEVFKAQTFQKKPPLTAISKVSMAASSEKYGATGNDRIFQNRL